MRKIKKLLVANRGEIACKIIKSAKKLNIPTLAIYSDEDINSIHVSLADEAINIPGSNVSDTYMNSMAIINICKKYKEHMEIRLYILCSTISKSWESMFRETWKRRAPTNNDNLSKSLSEILNRRSISSRKHEMTTR